MGLCLTTGTRGARGGGEGEEGVIWKAGKREGGLACVAGSPTSDACGGHEGDALFNHGDTGGMWEEEEKRE